MFGRINETSFDITLPQMPEFCHSLRKLSTGFTNAAFMA